MAAAEEFPWDRPCGLCAYCGAPLNEYCVGGYKLHDSKFSVGAAINMTDEQIVAAIETSVATANGLREYLHKRKTSRMALPVDLG